MQARRKLKSGVLVSGMPSKRDEAVLDAGGVRMESVHYKFSADAGAVGTLEFGRVLPAKAVVIGITLHEIANLTSGGSATVQVLAGSTALSDATAFGSIATGTLALASSATAIPLSLTSPSELKMAIATAALTAGELRIFVRYLLPND